MLDTETCFVLGAQDPEMREIERVLVEAGFVALHAARAGRRCASGDAYEADGVVRFGRNGVAQAQVLRPKVPVVLVECQVREVVPVHRIDHHQPGDSGFDAAPADYLRGSSLGQLLTLLEREPTATQRLLAAGDHCLTAAYQGECPGVDPDELLFLRASWQAKVSGRTLSDVMGGILDAARRVRSQFDATHGEACFLDPTRLPSDLPEGSARAGLPVRYRALLPDGTLKEMFKGGSPEAVARFMAQHKALGHRVYGNPHRGYAGAYS